MSQWVRLWEDMPDDPKWRVIAKRSGRPLHEIIAVFTRMLINAGRSSVRGTLEGWDDEDEAIALDMEQVEVACIRNAMQGKVLDGMTLGGWEKRQPKREDASTDRVKAFRERKSEAKRDETHGNARPKDETHGNAPEEKRGDTDKNPSPPAPREGEREGVDGEKVPAEKSLEVECRKIAVGMPVEVDCNFVPVLKLLDEGLLAEDVLSAMRAIAEKNHPLRNWHGVGGWARKSAKDRIERAMPSATYARDGPPPSPQANGHTLNFGSRNHAGKAKTPSDFLRAEIERRRDEKSVAEPGNLLTR